MNEPPASLIAQIVPDRVCVAEAPVGDHEAALFPAEAAHITAAVASRRREFATGRLLARRALAAIRGPEGELPAGADRAPCWPPGFVGSITHTSAQAAAVAARQADFVGIGIDIEIVSRISWRIMRRITTEAERRVLESAEADRQQRLLALLFSAKEAWFKCQYPIAGVYLDFPDAEITIDWARQSFEITRCAGVGGIDPQGWASGRFAWGDDLVATLVVLPPR